MNAQTAGGDARHTEISHVLRKTAIGFLAALIIALTALAVPAGATLPKPEEVVKITGVSFDTAPGPNQAPTLRVDAAILPGWHVNSNQPSSPDYIATRLSVDPPPSLRARDDQISAR